MPIASVIRKSGKFFFWVLVTIVLLLTLLLTVFRFAPQAYISLINKTTPYTITSAKLSAKLLPASLKFADLDVTHSVSGQATNQVAKASSLFAQVDWVGFLSDNHNFWYAELDGAYVYLNSIASESSASEVEPKNAASKPFNVHWLLSLLNMKVSNSTIVLNENTSLKISELNTDVGKKAIKQASKIKQNIQLSGNYQDNQKNLSISGSLSSQYRAGKSEIALNLGDIDLTAMLQAEEGAPKPQESQPTKVDWSWMDLIEPTALSVNISTLVLGDGRAESVSLKSRIDTSINVESLQAKLKWPLTNTLWLQDSFSISGTVTPDKDGSLDTKVSLAASQSEWEFEGLVNLNQAMNSRGLLSFSAKTLPLLDENQKVSKLITDNAQWFPLSSSLSVSPAEEGAPKQGINIELKTLKAGESDVSGTLNFTGLNNEQETTSPIGIQAQLASNLLRYQTKESAAVDATIEKLSKTKDTSKKKVFSDDPIDWSWLSSVLLDASIDIKELSVDERELDNIKLPVSLNKEGLAIRNADAELGDGAIRVSLEISPTQSQSKPESINLSLQAKASGIVLNDLKLVDEKTLKGGDSRLALSVSSNGRSAHELASNLSGDALFHLKKAVIGNDAFELIGSDLIGELISKLNPFLKSDPTTDLKCAVVNLDIDQGRVDVDKSIAIETSKMIIVADGKIDLEKERIKLGIKPQSTGGLGLDAGSLVKFLELGGTLSKPKPIVGADGLLKSGVAVGAAISTGGASLLLDGLVSKMASGKACERALKANKQPADR